MSKLKELKELIKNNGVNSSTVTILKPDIKTGFKDAKKVMYQADLIICELGRVCLRLCNQRKFLQVENHFTDDQITQLYNNCYITKS